MRRFCCFYLRCSSNFFFFFCFSFIPFSFCYGLIRFCLRHIPLLLNQLSILPVYGMDCSVDLHHGSLLLPSSALLGRTCWSASTSAFSSEAQPARRVGDWLGGWEAVARRARSGPRAAPPPPPPLPQSLCSSPVCSLHFSFFAQFSPFFSRSGSCGGGKTYGAVYLFWSGVGSHMSLADFHTSMTVV